MAESFPPNVTPLQAAGPSRRISSARYTDPDFLTQEMDRVFRRAWLALGPEWRIPRPGDYFTFDELGESILVIRGEDGTVRAMHNSCRHRGSRLVEGCGRLDAITCPYHGWTYGLDGRLEAIPKADGFDRIEQGKMGLHPARLERWAGHLWVNLDPEAPALRKTLGPIVEQLAPYELEDMRPIQTFDRLYPWNWKAMLENAIDFYHVPFVHRGTVGAHVAISPDLTPYGDHTRQRLGIAEYGWRARLDRACTRAGPYTDRQISSLHKYLIFPNFLINVLPYHLTVMQVFPVDSGHCRLRYSFCRRRGARGLELARALGTWVASRYILREDLRILDRLQRGLETGRVQHQHLHEEEGAATHFHAVLDRWMAG